MYVASAEDYSLREHSYTVPVEKFDNLMSDLDLFFYRFRRVVSSDIVIVPLRDDEEYRHVAMVPNDPVTSPLDSPQRQKEVLDALRDQKILLYCSARQGGRQQLANIATIYEDDGAITVDFNACEGLPVDPADLDLIVSSHGAGSLPGGDKFLNTPLEDGASWTSSTPYRGERRRATTGHHSRPRSSARR